MALILDQDGAVVLNNTTIEGAPALTISGSNVTFTNGATGYVESIASGIPAIEITGINTVVVNEDGGQISSIGFSEAAILGSAHDDTILNNGFINGIMLLAGGNDQYFRLLSETNNTDLGASSRVDLGAGDDVATFDMGGQTILNGFNITGGAGQDSITIANILAESQVDHWAATGVEELHLIGAADDARISFEKKPTMGDVYLSAGLHMEIYDNIGSTTAFTGAAAGSVFLQGGSLSFGMNVAFAQVIGSDAAERVTLEPRMMPPSGTPTPLNLLDMGRGDDMFLWHSFHSSPLTAIGGDGVDRVGVGQFYSTSSLSFTAFSGFEIIDHGLSNAWSGSTYLITGIGSDVQQLLLESDATPSSVQIDNVSVAGLQIGSGETELIIAANAIIGSIHDRSLLDTGYSSALSQIVRNLGGITGGVELAGGADEFVNAGAIGGAVYLGDGNDLFRSALGGSVVGGVHGGNGDDVYVLEHAGDTIVELAGEGTDEFQTALGAGSTLQQRRAAMYQLTSANVEILTGTSDQGQGLRGNSGDNIINAAAGDDYIDLTDGGSDDVNSGDGRDVLYYGSALDGGDVNDAGDEGGDTRGDLLVMQGDYVITLGAETLVDVEKLRVLKGENTSFGHDGTGLFSYNITTVNGNVAAGGLLVIQGGSLQVGETLTFDGSAETNGRFQIFGGRDDDEITGGSGDDHLLGRAGDDTITGNSGNDRIRGGTGNDQLDGGEGADTFIYAALPNHATDPYTNAALESTSLDYDTILGFDFAEDRIDLPQAVSTLAQHGTGSLSTATFDADLAAALDGILDPNSAVLFTADAGDLSGELFLVVDADGDGAYQANVDFVMEFGPLAGTAPVTSEIFV